MLSFKQILVSLLAILVIAVFSTITSKEVEANTLPNIHSSQKHSSNQLESNQDYIYYMYSNEKGHYFLQPTQEFENVILVSEVKKLKNLDIKKLHHGQKFIGTFTDESLWELIKIQEVKK